MDLNIKKIILIILITTFPSTIYSKNSCPNSSCGSSFFPINYPFKLETDQSPINCYNSIILRCDDQNHTIINLPYFGDFYVTGINYNLRRISLTYLQNCLPRMLMTKFSVFPLVAFSFENYTFYMCEEDDFTRSFEIQCLRNSKNAAVVIARDSSGYVEGLGCKPIVSSMIPVSSSDWENLGHLELTWDFPSCRQCELVHDPEKQGENKRKLAKLIAGSTVFIPLAVIFTTFFGIACFIRLLKHIVGDATTVSTETGTTTTTVVPPQSTAAPPQPTTAAPPQPTNAVLGNEASKVESFSQVMVLGENQQETSTCCSICLEEYHGRDRVRSLTQCGHLFHAECIDLWLQKNTTCPICRTSLSVF